LADTPHDVLIRVYDDAGNVIEMREHKGDFKDPLRRLCSRADRAGREPRNFASGRL
jgi:hypothetical protein